MRQLSQPVLFAFLVVLVLECAQLIQSAVSGAVYEPNHFPRPSFRLFPSLVQLGWECLSQCIASRFMFLEAFVFVMVLRLASLKGSRFSAQLHQTSSSKVCDIFGRFQQVENSSECPEDAEDFLRQFGHGFWTHQHSQHGSALFRKERRFFSKFFPLNSHIL